MTHNPKRLQREQHTVQFMIGIYCHGRHGQGETLCAGCRQLGDYAMQRIDKCPFQGDKPTCAQCPIHCYSPIRRQQVREVMRYAGPRMALYHPILALRHFMDGRRKADPKK